MKFTAALRMKYSSAMMRPPATANALSATNSLLLLAAGPVVAELSSQFDAYWNSSFAYPIDSIVPRPGAPEQMRARFEWLAGDDEPTVLHDDPETMAWLRRKVRLLAPLVPESEL